ADLEIQMERGPADLARVGLDREKLVELHRPMEIAFDTHARKPDSENLEEEPVVQPRLSVHFRFRQAEEPKVGLIVDDPGGVDVLPAHVFLDPIAGHAILPARALNTQAPPIIGFFWSAGDCVILLPW